MAEQEEEQQAEEKSGGKKKLIIIIVAILLLIVIGGVGAIFALSGGEKRDSASLEEGEEEEEYEEDVSELPGAVYPLEVFIVNLGVKGSFLKTSIQLEFYEPEFPPTLESDVPKLRDAIIQILSSKTSSEILGIDGKERLREEILSAVNDALGSEEVSQVYFTEFIVQ